MENKNRFISGVYHDLYEKKPSLDKIISRNKHKNAPQQEDGQSNSVNALEKELNTLMDDFYREEGILGCDEDEKPPFKPEEVRGQIEKLIGLSNIKEDIEALMDFVKIQKLRQQHGLSGSNLSLHTAFIGNPGTGKTTVARLMGEYFKSLGVLKKGHLVEVTRSDLVGQYVGVTAAKTNDVIDKALDGILFIDEAYALAEGGENDFGREAINVLVDRMDKERNRLAVFFAGYEENMKKFLQFNPGLASRVTRKFYFKDYTGPELMQIFRLQMERSQYTLDEADADKLEQYFTYLYDIRDNQFGNGRVVRNTLERLIKYQSDRLAEEEHVTVDMLKTITLEDIEKSVPLKDILVTSDKLETVMDELNEYIGLKNIKDHIRSLVNLIKTNMKREEAGLPVRQLSYHAIFCGSPGTGKTSIARILGRIYQALGVLKKGHVIEVDRSGLVAGFVGQTEEKTSKIIDEAMDGILFIDEAYALAGGMNDFGRNAIDTILKRMDDDRDRLIVIAAGYTNKMNTFIRSNPGLKDRFNWTFEFHDYNATELMDIFMVFANKQQYVLDADAKTALMVHFQAVVKLRDGHFGNGRYVRNLFEKTVMEQSNRIGANIDNIRPEDLTLITVEDVSRALLLL
jgi:SpoVK/Ycf46/Vps4 family AAA+-type ATPase